MEGSVRKKGNRWYYQFDTARINGKRHKIERYGGQSKGEAQDALREALNRYHNGQSVKLESTMSLHDYLEFWFTNYVEAKLKFNTQANYRNVINKYIDPKIGYYPLRSLTTRILEDFSQSLLTNYKLSNHSMAIIIGVLKKAIRMAVFPYELLSSSPAQLVSYPKRQLSVDELVRDKHDDLKIISINQYEKLLSCMDENDPFYMPIQISFWTGLRRGEVCGLEWKNVNLVAKEIKVSQQMIQISGKVVEITTPKTKNSYRTVHISDTLNDLLKTQKLLQKKRKLALGNKYFDSELVCTKPNGKPVTPNVIRYSLEKYRKVVDFEFDFHTFRHTHATMLIAAGANWKDIQKRLGHSRLATTMDTYAHVTTDRQKEVASKFESYISQIQ